MWHAVGLVTTGFTLVAFLAAVAAWVIRQKILEKERLLRTAPEEKRAELVAAALEFFNVDTRRLTKQQQFELALQQIRARGQRFLLTTILIALVALILAATVFAMNRGAGPKPTALFQMIDATTGDAVQRTLTIDFLADGVPGKAITVEDRAKGRFELSGDIAITDVRGFEGYQLIREEHSEVQDGRRIVKLARTPAFGEAISPGNVNASVSTPSYEAALNIPDPPDPEQVQFSCRNDTGYTVDLFFYRYFPPGKQPKFWKDSSLGPTTCPRGKETLVWDTFGSDRGGAFFFYASVGGCQARLITSSRGEAKPAYVLKSLKPKLVLTPHDGWFTGEVKHEVTSAAPDAPLEQHAN
jgi:hypothetical protein